MVVNIAMREAPQPDQEYGIFWSWNCGMHAQLGHIFPERIAIERVSGLQLRLSLQTISKGSSWNFFASLKFVDNISAEMHAFLYSSWVCWEGQAAKFYFWKIGWRPFVLHVILLSTAFVKVAFLSTILELLSLEPHQGLRVSFCLILNFSILHKD